jgi:transposase
MERNDRPRHLLQQLRWAKFGRKSERLDLEQLQLAIEDLEAAVVAEDDERQKTAQSVEPQKEKRRTNRAAGASAARSYHAGSRQYGTACPCCHGVTVEGPSKLSAPEN